MSTQQKAQDSRRTEMTNATIGAISKTLFPVMGIYGLVLKKRNEGFFDEFFNPDFDTMFTSIAADITKKTLRGVKCGNTFRLTFDWHQLHISFKKDNLESDNPELATAISDLKRLITAMGCHLDTSDPCTLSVWIDETGE